MLARAPDDGATVTRGPVYAIGQRVAWDHPEDNRAYIGTISRATSAPHPNGRYQRVFVEADPGQRGPRGTMHSFEGASDGFRPV